MFFLPPAMALRALPTSGRLAFHRENVTRLHHLLKPAQILLDLLTRFFAAHFGCEGPQDSRRRIVLKFHDHLGAAISGSVLKSYGTSQVHVAVQRTETDQFIFNLIDNLGVPLHGTSGGTANYPMRMAVI